MTRREIVVVDDERFMLDILSFHLNEFGFGVTAFDKANAAIEHVREGHGDLVITDWMMPQMNGRELIEQLREKADGEQLPVIVVTAKELTLDEREFLLSHKCLSMSKPVDGARLFDKVSEVLT